MSLTRMGSTAPTPPTPPHLLPYAVSTSTGTLTLYAYSRASAISTALELLGGTLRTCTHHHDW